MTAPRAARLVAEDEELLALLNQAENVLLLLAWSEECSAEPDTDTWDLPAPIAGRTALEALNRVWTDLDAVLDTLRIGEPAAGPRLLGPDGRYEHAPLRLAELDQADLETLTAALGVLNRALTSRGTDEGDPRQLHQLRDLSELLENMEVDTSLWPLHAEPATAADLLRPLARLVAVLDMPPDDDTALLLTALSGRTGDVVLTPAGKAAYQRLANRITLVIADSDPIHRYLY